MKKDKTIYLKETLLVLREEKILNYFEKTSFLPMTILSLNGVI